MTIKKTRCNSFKSIWSFRNYAVEKKALFFICVVIVFIYLYYIITSDDKHQQIVTETSVFEPHANQKYLINTSKCRIPDIDPFNKEIIKFVIREKYEPCSHVGLLTYIDKSNDVVRLRVNTSLLSLYSSWKITCCYSNISRINYVKKSDTDIKFSACTKFESEANISYPFIKVLCSNMFGIVYSNVHATTIPTEEQRISTDRKNRFGVLLVGIDSISKLNLRRTMPKTYRYLEENLISLRGYNKIGDNTFPNLMAILTGKSMAQMEKNCSREVKVNYCDIIWDTFRNLGYVTAYAEDEANIATFNYDRPGFLDPPTDYYYYPYMIASEGLTKKLRYGMTFCAGPETSAERIFNSAKDFSVSFKNVPIFGLFWSNSFSHDNINLASAMDEKVVEIISDGSFRSSLQDTFFIFFSDHGFRFGDIRYTHTGWLEERLPFIYIHVPDSFKKKYPQKYTNFLINSNRLTTPYDIHNTLQEILEIGNDTYKSKKSFGCPKCHSLFEEGKEDRTCKDAAIEQHWCTCSGHTYINPKEKIVWSVAEFVVEKINNLTASFPEGQSCARYILRNVVTAGMSEPYLNEHNRTVNHILVMAETKPNAMFEATVEASLEMEQTSFKILGDISRISRYGENSVCVRNTVLKKYCYCGGIFNLIKKGFCFIFQC